MTRSLASFQASVCTLQALFMSDLHLFFTTVLGGRYYSATSIILERKKSETHTNNLYIVTQPVSERAKI